MSNVKTTFKSERNEKFFDFLKKYGKRKVAIEVGIHSDNSSNRREESEVKEGKSKGDATTNLEVAISNEFGVPERKIPERSFVRASVRANAKKYEEIRKKGIKLMLNGKLKVNDYLENLGEIARSDMKEYAIELSEPPNAPYTIEQKKSSNPLVDTSQMVKAIDYQIVDKQ